MLQWTGQDGDKLLSSVLSCAGELSQVLSLNSLVIS